MTSAPFEFRVNTLPDLKPAAEKLLAFCDNTKLIFFKANMGAGKTTFIKSICECLGSRDNFSSPTFSLVNEYASPQGKIFHFDLYRLQSVKELFDIGIEDYLSQKAYCFVEWPEMLIDIIDSNYVLVEIKIEENIRYIRASKVMS